MARRDPNYIDVHVGSRIRVRRQLINMSQERLGELLGITFQQVQKYEKGTNRISASRLFYTAKTLGVPSQAVAFQMIRAGFVAMMMSCPCVRLCDQLPSNRSTISSPRASNRPRIVTSS